ncbi:hypothetical protein ZIOFF_006787 [Zingiber officinale]|uniref:Uncharacterized protein n=1 Tax=Zingiber officinale TaxID=94328 RepID=A0A8J5HSR0_ZINOF|nr:hypothetical protein ZIOFF_006787 [Zingiber officinale]
MRPRLTDPSSPNAHRTSCGCGGSQCFPLYVPSTLPQPRGPYYRRARCGDPVAGWSVDEIGSEDDLFYTFVDIEKVGCKLEPSGSGSEGGDYADRAADSSPCDDDRKVGDKSAASESKHRRSFSVDGWSATS